jgi:hypothetical protein
MIAASPRNAGSCGTVVGPGPGKPVPRAITAGWRGTAAKIREIIRDLAIAESDPISFP